MKNNFWAKLFVCLLSYCAINLPDKGNAAGIPYTIDVVLPTSGSVSFLGLSEMRDLKIEEKVINASGGIHGRPVDFVFKDDQSSAMVAVQVTNQILANRPQVIIGSALVASCNAMAPLVQNGPVLYCLSPGVYPPRGSYVFSSSVSTANLIDATIRYFRFRGWTRIAVLTSTDATGQDAERGINAELQKPENKNMQIVAAARFNPTDITADAQIQHMRAADPQAIIAWTTGTSLGTVFRAITNAGWNVPVAITESNMVYKEMAQFNTILPPQLYIASPDWLPSVDKSDMPATVRAAQNQMFSAFKASGVAPDIAAALSWDPTMTVVTALKTLPLGVTPERLRDYLTNLTDYNGISGVYNMQKIPQRGIGLESVVMTRWDRKALNWVVVSHPTGTPF
jgi:branched-chain amino acid transport system substrate-binding protein